MSYGQLVERGAALGQEIAEWLRGWKPADRDEGVRYGANRRGANCQQNWHGRRAA